MTRQLLRIAASVSALALCSLALAAPDTIPAPADNPRAEMLRYETALKANPDDLAARLGLAEALMALGEYDRAEKMAELVLNRTGKMEARVVLAETLLRQGRLDEAAGKLALPHALEGDAAALSSVIRAEQALAAGNIEDTLRTIQPIMSHPRYAPLARVVAARGFYAAGKLALAKRLVDDIIAEGGDSLTALLFRARLALLAGDAGTAERLADGIDALDPGNVSAGAIAIEALLREGRIEEARTRLEKLRPVSGEDPRPAYLKGILLAAEGKPREAALAVSTIEEWLELSSGGAIFLADLKSDLGFDSQAEAILRERLNADPTDIAIVRELTSLLDRQGRTKHGDDVIARSLGVMPTHPVLLRLKADRLAARGEFEAAMNVLAAIPGDEDAPDIFNVLGEGRETALAARMSAAIRAGDPGLAIRLAEGGPGDDPMVQNMLAAALVENGELGRARTVLDRLIATDPDFLAASLNRAGLDASPTSLVETLKLAEAAGASSAQIFRQLAIESFVVGDGKQALAAARKAAMAEDRLASDLFLPARIELAQGDQKSSAALLRKESGAEDMTVADNIYRLWLLSLTGEKEAAAREAKAIALPQGDEVSAFRLADIFRAADDRPAETAILAQLRVKAPQDLALTERYLVSLAATDPEAAQEALKKLDGVSEEIKGALAVRLLIEAGRKDEARKQLESLPPSALLYAITLELAETDAEKEALLGRMAAYAEKTPGDLGVLVLLSGVAVETGDLARAEKALSTALAAMPGNPAVLNNLALARAKKSPEEALRLAADAYQAAPQNAAFAETYASLLVATGDEARAGRIARRTRLADPLAEGLEPYLGLAR